MYWSRHKTFNSFFFFWQRKCFHEKEQGGKSKDQNPATDKNIIVHIIFHELSNTGPVTVDCMP